MAADGYSGGQLYSYKYGAYSVVVAARTGQEAGQAMIIFLRDRGTDIKTRDWPYSPPRKIKNIGDRHLIIAHPTPGT